MPMIKIDGQEYDTETLSNEAKAQLASIQFCDQELARLKAQAAAYQTARMAYAKALKDKLPTVPRSSTVRRVSTLISLTFGLKRAPTTGSSAGFDLAV